MNGHLKYSVNVTENDAIEVKLNHPANVWLLDDMDYYQYKSGRVIKNNGIGRIEQPKIMIKTAYKGKWHIIIDSEEDDTTEIKATVSVVQRWK